jgi:hypothetical protein
VATVNQGESFAQQERTTIKTLLQLFLIVGHVRLAFTVSAHQFMTQVWPVLY